MSINALIGDESWTTAHSSPPASAREITRIRTHLLFVLDKLRTADTTHLTSEQSERRAQSLDDLAEYARAGVFPRRAPGDGFGARWPRFIDDRGVHCAVGELIHRSGHPELALSIDDQWEYALVEDIDSAALIAWAESHGFEAHELAMIQPMYAPSDPVSLFIFHFIFAGILFGWGGLVGTIIYLCIAQPKIGWVRLTLVALGGWAFCAAAIAVLLQIPMEAPKAFEALFFAVLLVLQIAYSWGACWLAKRFVLSPKSQRAILDRAMSDLDAETREARRSQTTPRGEFEVNRTNSVFARLLTERLQERLAETSEPTNLIDVDDC